MGDREAQIRKQQEAQEFREMQAKALKKIEEDLARRRAKRS